MPRRRRRSFAPLLRRVLLVSLLLVVVVAVLGVGAVTLLFDPNAYKPDIAAAVHRATGHPLILSGPIRMHFGLPPRLVAEDVGLANAPGSSNSDMVIVQSIAARVALLPLLSGEVRIVRLDLVQPQVQLQTGATDPGTAASVPPPAAAAATSATAHGSSWRIDVSQLHIRDARIGWHDQSSGRSATLQVPQFDAVVSAPGASVVLSGTVVSQGRTLALSGETSSLARLLDPAASTPASVEFVLQGDAGRLAVRGVVQHPLQGRGYALQVDAAITDLTPFAPLLPEHLPPLRDASLSARVTDNGRAIPDISALALHLGGLQLPDTAPGLVVGRADLTAADLAAPIQAEAQGTLHGARLHVVAKVGPVPALSGGDAAAPVPLHATLELGGSQLLADVVVTPTARPAVEGTVSAQRVDLDPLLVAFFAAPAATQAAAPPPAAGPPRPAKPAHVISDEPFDLGALDRADVDVQFTAATLLAGGVSYGNLAGHLVVHDGNLTLDPFGADVPGGRLDAKLAVDARAADAPASLVLHSPSLALQPLAAAYGKPDAITGTGFFDVDLRGHGRSPHALAASADGHLGLAVSEGEVDNATLTGALGGVLRTARLPETLFGTSGRSRLHCLALRLVSRGGVGEATTLVADATKLMVQGYGSLDFGAETLSLHLRPLLRVGPGVVVPVRVNGPFLDPKWAIEGGGKGGLPSALAGTLASVLAGTVTPDPTAGDVCPGALAAVRAEAPPAPPAAAAQAEPLLSSAPPPKPPKPIDVLRNLLAH
jgi:uncharacterized protein involved in outer membrane biogenesis